MAGAPEPGPQRSVRAAVVLTAAALAAFGLVAWVHDATRDRIEATAHAQALARFDEVLAGRSHDNDLLADPVTIHDTEAVGVTTPVLAYRARRNGAVIAVVMELVALEGYSGPIRLLVAIAPDGTVLATRVVQHRETPGLGDFIEARKSDWIRQFADTSLRSPTSSGWRVRKDGGEFDQYTGATVTSRAVVTAVAGALGLFERHRDVLLAAPVTIEP